MPVIKVSQSDLIKDLDVLMRYVLKFVYVYTNKWDARNMDPHKERMTLDEVHLMQESIVWWGNVELKRLKNKTERKILLFKLTANEVDKDHQNFVEEKLQTIGWMLRENDLGRFDARKEEFYFKSIDYRKFHRLPEAYTEKDYAQGAEALRVWNDKNQDLAG